MIQIVQSTAASSVLLLIAMLCAHVGEKQRARALAVAKRRRPAHRDGQG